MKNEENMRIKKLVQRKRSFGLREAFLLLVASAIGAVIVAHATPPALKITPLGGGDMQLTVTNGSATNSYEIYFTPNFDPGYQWNVLIPGSTGQSNFTVSSLFTQSGFYKALNINDIDGDGIVSWQDANDTNSAIGILSVIIDTPTNHYTFR